MTAVQSSPPQQCMTHMQSSRPMASYRRQCCQAQVRQQGQAAAWLPAAAIQGKIEKAASLLGHNKCAAGSLSTGGCRLHAWRLHTVNLNGLPGTAEAFVSHNHTS